MKTRMSVKANKQSSRNKEIPSKLKAVMVAVMLATAPLSAHAVLERVGPTSTAPSIGGFPSWYQDTTGLTLEFCDPKNQLEVDGGWCLLLPADVPLVPEVFPTSFFDEHFYFAGTALMDAANGGKATLVLALESAFATGPAVPGDQITFARIRARLTNVPLTGTYRVIHPYGEEQIDAIAGDRIFYTEDIGIGAAGDFSGALTSRLGPFLLPADAPGGAELAAVAGPAGLYVADPARIGPVTGSTLPDFIDSTGALRNHNTFRIEGPVGSGLGGPGIDFIETSGFSLMGRVFTGTIPGRTDVKRASYTRDATGQKVDVYANAFETIQARVPPAAQAAPVLPQLSFYDAPCAGTVDPATGAILPPYSAPVGAVETPMSADGNDFWGQAQLAALPAEVCVVDNSATDALGNPVPRYVPKQVADQVTITQAYYDPVAQALSVAADSSDTLAPPTLTLAFGAHLVDLVAGQASVTPLAAPPSKITVRSSAFGASDYLVSTTAPAVVGTAPVIDTLPVLAATDGVAFSYGITATDAEGGPIDFSLDQAPAGMTISAAGALGATLAWTPTTAEVGTQTVTVRATDPTGLSTTQSYSIVVAAAAGTAPAIGSTPALAAMDGAPYAYGVTATDAEGGPLAFTLDQAPAGMTISAIDGLSASIAWTPTTADVGTQTVTVRATDPTGLFTTQSWSIAVAAAAAPGAAPVIGSTPALAATDGQAYTYRVTATDADGGLITFTLDQAPAGMTILSSPVDGAIVWTPTTAQVGTQTVTVRATDPTGLFTTQSWSVTVASATVVNNPPVVANDAFTMIRGTTMTFAAPGVLANDSDPDAGDTLTATNWNQPSAGGTLVGNPDGSFSYTPPPAFRGLTSFSYLARDNHGMPSATAGFASIAVRDNRAPTTVAETATTTAGTPLVINVLVNDSDLDTVIDPSNHIDPATVFIPAGKGPDRGGSVVVNADGTITYTPAPGFTGIEKFQYAVRDTYVTPAISKAANVDVTVQ